MLLLQQLLLLLVAIQLTSSLTAAAAPPAASQAWPPPRWWELGGGSVMAFSPKVALGRGLWPKGQMVGLPAYLALLDQLHADGVNTLQLATVYDCGASNTTYDPSFLFSGLAGSNYSKINTNIGGDAEWMTFIEHAHSLNISVTSFWNAAYFWTGSPYVKQAEADIRAHGLTALPADSPARWFRWSPHRAQRVKPPDDSPNPVGDWGWVWDPDCNASYLSVWGDSPSTNLASTEWRAEMKRILTRWITTLKLDGCA